MDEAWFDQLTDTRRKLERVKTGLIKSKISEPIVLDLLQNLIDAVDDRLERIKSDFGMVKCSECNYATQSDQALAIHKKMVHI